MLGESYLGDWSYAPRKLEGTMLTGVRELVSRVCEAFLESRQVRHVSPESEPLKEYRWLLAISCVIDSSG